MKKQSEDHTLRFRFHITPEKRTLGAAKIGARGGCHYRDSTRALGDDGSGYRSPHVIKPHRTHGQGRAASPGTCYPRGGRGEGYAGPFGTVGCLQLLMNL